MKPVMAIVRRTKSDDNSETSASVTGSGCDVTCDSKSRRCVLDVTNDVTSTR